MSYTDWDPRSQTDEAKTAFEEWVRRAHMEGRPLDPHDPEMLMCLDKGDIVSRYQLLLHGSRMKLEEERKFHEAEKRRLVESVGDAARWWKYCLSLRARKRKTVQLSDMFPAKVGDDDV